MHSAYLADCIKTRLMYICYHSLLFNFCILSRRQLNNLTRNLHRLEEQILLKTSSHELDSECLKMREEAPSVMRWMQLEKALNPNSIEA